MSKRRAGYRWELVETLKGEKVVRATAEADDKTACGRLLHILSEMKACGFVVTARLVRAEGGTAEDR
jgi:hypothetical protein